MLCGYGPPSRAERGGAIEVLLINLTVDTRDARNLRGDGLGRRRPERGTGRWRGRLRGVARCGRGATRSGTGARTRAIGREDSCHASYFDIELAILGGLNGGQGRNRTSVFIFSAVLYQLSYLALRGNEGLCKPGISRTFLLERS